MSLALPEFNRDSFDHLNTSIYDFWTTFALSIVSGLLVGDFASAFFDQFGPVIKLLGTFVIGAAIATPAPVFIGATIWEGKDQHYLKCLMDFPLHPGGLMIDFVEQGVIDLVSSESEVPKVEKKGEPGKTTKEAKVPKDPALLDEVIEAKAAGFHSFAVHVEVPQRKWPGKKEAFQPVEDIVFHSPVPKAAAMVPEVGSGVYKGVSMKRLAHQVVIACFYVKSIHYTIGSKPVPIFRITWCRGESLRQLKGGKMLAMTQDELGLIVNAYATLGSVEIKMERDQLKKENEELKQTAQNAVWDYHSKAKEALDKERQAFGGEPLSRSTLQWLGTRNGKIGITIVAGFIGIFLYFLSQYLASTAKVHP